MKKRFDYDMQMINEQKGRHRSEPRECNHIIYPDEVEKPIGEYSDHCIFHVLVEIQDFDLPRNACLAERIIYISQQAAVLFLTADPKVNSEDSKWNSRYWLWSDHCSLSLFHKHGYRFTVSTNTEPFINYANTSPRSIAMSLNKVYANIALTMLYGQHEEHGPMTEQILDNIRTALFEVRRTMTSGYESNIHE